MALIIILSGTCPLPCRSVGNLLSPPHRREYEDCKQILKLSLKPTHTLNARQDFSQASCQKTCPMGRAVSEDCHSASVPLRCTPSERQSSSIHNSLRSIKQIAVLRLKSSSPANLADSAIFPTDKISASFSKICSPRSRKTQACNAPQSPQGKNNRLRYRSAKWTVSSSWPARLT